MITGTFTTEAAVTIILEKYTKAQVAKMKVIQLQEYLVKQGWHEMDALSRSLPAYVYILFGKDIDKIKIE